MKKMTLLLMLLAPYLAVALFWCVWPNAWLAILAYHAQILFWCRPALRNIRRPLNPRSLLLALPMALAGPLLYLLLPVIAPTDRLSSWLETYHVSGVQLALMIPYFGFVHPILEQLHWHRLRENTALSHLAFAGYHMIVLSTLLTPPWLFFCFGVLVAASLAWKLMARATDGLTVPVLSHVLADLGIVVAAWVETQ